jgi:hypothetical protein
MIEIKDSSDREIGGLPMERASWYESRVCCLRAISLRSRAVDPFGAALFMHRISQKIHLSLGGAQQKAARCLELSALPPRLLDEPPYPLT